MQVRDLLEICNRLDPHQQVRVVMTGLHMVGGENGDHPCGPAPTCRFTDGDAPEVKADKHGTIEFRFSAE